MADIEPFATLSDYESIYGAVTEGDKSRVTALLLRASGYLLSKKPGYVKGEDALFDLNASTVTCAMAHRVMCVPGGMEGVSQFQQTAGSYSASVSMLDQYMRPLPSELELLGLNDGSFVASVRMTTDADI